MSTPDAEGRGETSDIGENSEEWSAVRIAVTRDTIDSAGEVETIELATGKFENGEVTTRGSVEQPTEVKISVETDGSEPLTLDALIAPNATVSFVLVDDRISNLAKLEFFGKYWNTVDTDRLFTVSGDLSSIDADLELATVSIRGWEYDYLGGRVDLNFGTVMIDNEDKFEIEVEADEDRVVDIVVDVPVATEQIQLKAIFERGVKIEVRSHSSNLRDLYLKSNKGTRHKGLIEGWQQSEEFLETKQQYNVAYQEYLNRIHNNENSPDTNKEETPKHIDLLEKLDRIRVDYLERVVANRRDDWMFSLLALELGAYWGNVEVFSIYDELERRYREDFLMRRATHARNNHALHLAKVGNDPSLAMGYRVPDFNLPNTKFERIEIRDIYENNKLVLLTFWASWCGPYIEALPQLKEVYSKYREDGFEIVSISLDHRYGDWVSASEEHQIPWVNLGEMKVWDGDVATSYSVTYVPKSW